MICTLSNLVYNRGRSGSAVMRGKESLRLTKNIFTDQELKHFFMQNGMTQNWQDSFSFFSLYVMFLFVCIRDVRVQSDKKCAAFYHSKTNFER